MTSFDIVGDIAIIEADNRREAKKIAEDIIKNNSHVKAVLMKKSQRSGQLRLRELDVVINRGKKKPTETIHVESGCRLMVDVSKAYFSPREGTERLRIAEKVKPGEKVLVLFSGVGPFGVVIGKRSEAGHVVCVEINRDACKYAEENIRLNKLQEKVDSICSDMNELGPGFENRFDRVLMPLPKESYLFLGKAISFLKTPGTIHFYYIEGEGDGMSQSSGMEKTIGQECRKLGKNFKIIEKRKVLPYAPGVSKMCLDIEIKDKPGQK